MVNTICLFAKLQTNKNEKKHNKDNVNIAWAFFFSPLLLTSRIRMNITFDCLVSNAHEEINKLNQAKRNEMEAKFIYNFFSSLFWFLTICVNSFVMDNSKENHRLVLVRAFTHTEKKHHRL